MFPVVTTDEIRSSQPRIEGTRITVLDIKRRVIDEDDDPHVVAGEYDISLAELFNALTYYYEHREKFENVEREVSALRRDGERQTREILERVKRGDDESAEQADRRWKFLQTRTYPRSTSLRFEAMATRLSTAGISTHSGQKRPTMNCYLRRNEWTGNSFDRLPFDPASTEPLWLSTI